MMVFIFQVTEILFPKLCKLKSWLMRHLSKESADRNSHNGNAANSSHHTNSQVEPDRWERDFRKFALDRVPLYSEYEEMGMA